MSAHSQCMFVRSWVLAYGPGNTYYHQTHILNSPTVNLINLSSQTQCGHVCMERQENQD